MFPNSFPILDPSMQPSALPSISPTFHPSFCPTNDPLESEKIHLFVYGENITEDNKDDVCQSIAQTLGGEVKSCTLQPQSSGATLYVEIAVFNALDSTEVVESEGFVDSLENLPPGILISGVTVIAGNTSFSMKNI